MVINILFVFFVGNIFAIYVVVEPRLRPRPRVRPLRRSCSCAGIGPTGRARSSSARSGCRSRRFLAGSSSSPWTVRLDAARRAAYGGTKEKVFGVGVLCIWVLLFLFRRIVQDKERPHWREETPTMPDARKRRSSPRRCARPSRWLLLSFERGRLRPRLFACRQNHAHGRFEAAGVRGRDGERDRRRRRRSERRTT